MQKNELRWVNCVFLFLLLILLVLLALTIGDISVHGNVEVDSSIYSVVALILIICVFAISFFMYVALRFSRRKMEIARIDHNKLILNEIEYRIAAKISNIVVFHYDLITHVLSARVESFLESSGYPKTFTNIPESAIDGGFIHKDSALDFIEFFNKMYWGIETAESKIKIRNLISDGFVWQVFRYNLFKDAKGVPKYSVITVSYAQDKLDFETEYSKLHDYVLTLPREGIAFFEYNISKESFIRKEGELNVRFYGLKNEIYTNSIVTYIKEFVHSDSHDEFIEKINRDKLITSFYDNKPITNVAFREKGDGEEYYWRNLYVQTIENNKTSEIHAYFLFTDIDDEKKLDIYLRQQNEEDPLTHALNRSAFMMRINPYLEKNNGQSHALLIIDIDDFKTVNDVYGHFAGDQVLIEVVQRIKSVCNKNDYICRLGGDEFLVFLTNVQYDAVLVKKAQQICNVLRMKLDDDVKAKNYLSVSVGATLYPNDGLDFDTLYKNADAALYSSKRHGKDRYAIYDFSMKDEKNNVSLIDKMDYVLNPVSTTKNDVTKKYILVVDDDKLCCDLLENMFMEEYTIYRAHNGEEALEKINQYASSLSVILLDIVMPVMDGYEVIKQISANSRLRSIPIIVITGLSDMPSNIKAVSLGATDFVTKPFEPALVKLRVKSAIMKYENEKIRAQNDYLLIQSSEDEKYHSILDSTGTVVIEYDYSNQVFIYSDRISDYISGVYDRRPLWDIWLKDMICEPDDVSNFKNLVEKFVKDKTVITCDDKISLLSVSGEKQWFSVELYKYSRENTSASKILIAIRNIDKETKANERLVSLSERDLLTGVYNRSKFIEEATKMISSSSPYSYCLACIDMDNFKIYNDLYGHAQGDVLLKYMANCIKEAINGNGISCRLSADFFAILYPNDDDSKKRVVRIKNKMLEFFNNRFPMRMKCGIFVIDDSHITVEMAFDCAMVAHQYAKRRYDYFAAMYDENMKSKFIKERKIIMEMETALTENQFAVYFQPQFDYAKGEIDGAEALVRWTHPEDGVILPGEFISLFEENGFISRLDQFVRRCVCKHIREMVDKGLDVVPISINISRIDIYDPNLIGNILELVKEYDISPDLIHFEITESAYLKDSRQLITTISELRKNGFVVEMDDFGSGYSSLNSLSDFDIDVLKLDMRFIENEDNTNKKMLIIKNVIDMAHDIDLSVIAEGVEYEEQAEALMKLGCNRMQGYLFYKPLSFEEFQKLLKKKQLQ